MKQSTKENIIDWLKVPLNYKPENPPFIVKHREVQIQDVQWIGTMEEYDHDYNLKNQVASKIADELIKRDLIKIKSSFLQHAGMWASKRYQVSAKLSVVLIDGGDDFEYGSNYYPEGIPT